MCLAKPSQGTVRGSVTESNTTVAEESRRQETGRMMESQRIIVLRSLTCSAGRPSLAATWVVVGVWDVLFLVLVNAACGERVGM